MQPHCHFQLSNACVLITGASSGLGAEFARQLAPDASILILVARRGERLQSLSEELSQAYPHLTIHQRVADLTRASAREDLVAWIQEQQLPLNFLINNAGLGDLGNFFNASWSRLDEIITLNVTALTHLTHLLLPLLRSHQPSALLHVGSVAGFFPLPGNSVYAASKAYVNNFSEALSIEERSHGVFVSLLSPGPVETEFFEVASRPGEKIVATSRVPGLLVTSSHDVVAAALKGLLAHQTSIIPNRFLRGVMRLLSMLPDIFLKKILSRHLD